MKIYTKTGDDGTSALFGGQRVSKAHIRLHAYGTTDELNSFVGLLCAQPELKAQSYFLQIIQNELFVLGSHLATEAPNLKKHLPEFSQNATAALEQAIDEMEAQLPKLTNFVLPGGSQAIALCHVCRTVCRRAERYCVEIQDLEPMIQEYLNRLSDYFFVLSRFIAQQTGIEQTIWRPRS
jgi:cob(I)alamin adenosyltransferase